MSFMQPEIVKQGFYIVDGPCCTEHIPDDVASLPDYDEWDQLDNQADYDDQDDWYLKACHDALKDYTSNNKFYIIEHKQGYGARMSAPGYLDCTEWTFCDTLEESIEELLSNYGTQDDGELEDWEIDLLDELHGINPQSATLKHYDYPNCKQTDDSGE